MDELALERYFDNFIANDSTKTEQEKVSEELDIKVFLSLLPDELQALNQDLTDSSSSLDHNSQNSTAVSELQDSGSSVSELDASPGRPRTSTRPEILPQIQNVMSTVKLGCSLDLSSIAHKVWNIEYNVKTHRAIIMRLREPRTTALIFKSGNIVCTGAKSVEQSRLAARRFARIVQKLGFPARFLNFKIQNLVANVYTFPVSLDKLARHQSCSYEPELFPGLHYPVMPGVIATIFSTGNMYFTGAKTEAEIHEAFDTIYPVLSCFRR